MSNVMRPEIDALEISGISRIAIPYMNDPEVVPLWFGEGDLATPDFIRDAAKQALDEGRTFYRNSRGRPDTVASIKSYLDRSYDIDLDPERISQLGSSMLAVTVAAQCTLGRGDHCIITSPNWPNIELTVKITGAEYSHVRQSVNDGKWSLSVEDIVADIRPNTRMIYLNSPCNPTGWVMPIEDMQALLDVCRERNILILSDEVYHRHIYGQDIAPSFMTLARDDDPVIVVNGMSKSWAMTGWRMGWLVAPRYMEDQMTVFGQAYNTGSPDFTQAGLCAALDHGDSFANELKAHYQGGRDIVTQALGGLERVEYTEPQGAFYAFPRIRGLQDSMQFAMDLVKSEKVGVSPGYTFGPDNDDHIRLAFALSHDRLTDAMARVANFIERMD